MSNSKTFAFAALAALSLGIGTAMAQEGDSAFWQYQNQVFPAAPTHQVAPLMVQPQAGSSDVSRTQAPTYAAPSLLGGDGGGQ